MRNGRGVIAVGSGADAGKPRPIQIADDTVEIRPERQSWVLRNEAL